MILDKINNNTYVFILIILLIIILFNLSCFMENKVNYTTYKKINNNKETLNKETLNENFENNKFITTTNLVESEVHKDFFNKNLVSAKQIYSFIIRLKNNNNKYNINSLNLENDDLIKIKSDNEGSDYYLKINKIYKTENKPGYTDIQIIDENSKLIPKKKN